MSVKVGVVDDLVAVETVSPGGVTGHCVVVSAEEWLAVVAAAEELAPVRELRHRRSVAAAKEASSHYARGAA